MTPTTETSDEDFSIMIHSLVSAGSVSLKAIGSRIRRKVSTRDMPVMSAASISPFGTPAKPPRMISAW